MSDIELVIKIPEEQYEFIKQMTMYEVKNNRDLLYDICIGIRNGTPLPKGHGRLMILSEDKLKENQMNLDFSCQKWISEIGLSNSIVSIVEADKDESEFDVYKYIKENFAPVEDKPGYVWLSERNYQIINIETFAKLLKNACSRKL